MATIPLAESYVSNERERGKGRDEEKEKRVKGREREEREGSRRGERSGVSHYEFRLLSL
jgi:hypothetical protein